MDNPASGEVENATVEQEVLLPIRKNSEELQKKYNKRKEQTEEEKEEEKAIAKRQNNILKQISCVLLLYRREL